MQESVSSEVINHNKDLLLTCIGKIVKEERHKLRKGINIFSFEYDIGNGLLSKLEKGLIDTRVTTMWKLANAFGYKCSEFVKLIEKELPENFNFYI